MSGTVTTPTGSAQDFANRASAVVPYGWFPDDSPILDALLLAFGDNHESNYLLLQYVKKQTRIATTSDIWLDGVSTDFFGTGLPRGPVETDGSFRFRIDERLFQPQATRAAVINALKHLTGFAPIIFEPARPTDTGGYGSLTTPTVGTNLAYGKAGGYGSLMLPNQCFITAFRPQSGGVGNIAGYGHIGSGISMPGGYGVGAIAYETLAAVSNPVNDAAIYAAIANVIPAATIAWTQLQGYGSAPAPGHLDVDFILGVSVLA